MKRYIKSAEFTDVGTGLEYWYFTTHGVQPGSVPTGLNILEIKDTPNGAYFKTDKVILTDALKQYDIKEKRPVGASIARTSRSTVTASVDWSYYDKFQEVMDNYLPSTGEGDTKASQIVTAITKLVYKWYNDGDVFDNNYYLTGWANDLSSYANWLYSHVHGADRVLDEITECYTDDDYEVLLQELADRYLDMSYLRKCETDTEGSIYSESGPFSFSESGDDEEEDW